MRKCQIGERNITAAQVRDSTYIEDFVEKDQGYNIFKQLRNSPSYLETRKKGYFCKDSTIRIARWIDLFRMFAKLNNNVEYSDNQIEEKTWEQKSNLIQKDPVTCTRYFDHRVQEFVKIVLKSTHNPIGVITDYFYCVEFQQRGSSHLIAWIYNSPKFNVDQSDSITQFVDTYLKCPSKNENLKDLVQLQLHNIQ